VALLGTGLPTITFAFLAQESAGERVDTALGTALVIKMVMYGTVCASVRHRHAASAMARMMV